MLYDYQTWSEELLIQVKDDDDPYGGQRSSEVKCGKLCAIATKCGQENRRCKYNDDLHRDQRSTTVNINPWLPNLTEQLI